MVLFSRLFGCLWRVVQIQVQLQPDLLILYDASVVDNKTSRSYQMLFKTAFDKHAVTE